VRLRELSKTKPFSFLQEVFDEVKPSLGSKFRNYSLDQYVRWMDDRATETMLRNLPYEAPGYKKNDPRFRTADAALMYLLHLKYPAFLAERSGKPARWIARMERLILKEIGSLFDERTGGICRYGGDSYQRAGFFRHSITKELNEMYGGVSGDASSSFQGRNRIVPKGRQAAWAHFTWQVSAWAGRRFLEGGGEKYRTMHERFFIHGLRMVTGPDEASIDIGATGSPQVITIDEGLMPECYVSDTTDDGRTIVFPSPHTPLNWAVAEMRDAFAVRREIVSRRR
jgi:hypothetical protein